MKDAITIRLKTKPIPADKIMDLRFKMQESHDIGHIDQQGNEVRC